MLLGNRPEPQSGRYNLVVKELNNSVDSLDWASLVTIDHDTNSTVIISGRGDSYELLQTVPPSASVDNWGNDILGQLLYEDGIFFSSEDSGWIDITFSGLDTISLLLNNTTTGTIMPPPGKTPTPLAS